MAGKGSEDKGGENLRGHSDKFLSGSGKQGVECGNQELALSGEEIFSLGRHFADEAMIA